MAQVISDDTSETSKLLFGTDQLQQKHTRKKSSALTSIFNTSAFASHQVKLQEYLIHLA